MRIVVVGGGIGGLALAQGLRRHGGSVVVVERDVDLARTGGYRLHLGARALAALREVLDPSLVELLYASSATNAFDVDITVRDHRGRLLVHVREGEGRGSLDVDRVTLRLLLATGLDDVLLRGRTCTGHRQDDEGVVVSLDDGSELRADVLVGADGVASLTAAALAGGPTSRPVGVSGLAGSTRAQALRRRSLDLLDGGSVLAVGPGGAGLYVALHDPAGRSAVRLPAGLPDPVRTREPVVIWGLVAVDGVLPSSVRSSPPAERVHAAGAVLRQRRWSDDLVEVVERTDANGAGAFRFSAADPAAIAPWPASRVTALGDAVHAVPPTGGQGAATAVVDAALLCTHLAAAVRGEVTPAMALHDYEKAMRPYAAAAVRESLEPLRWIRASASGAGALAARAVLPAATTVAATVRRLRRADRHQR